VINHKNFIRFKPKFWQLM